ncbi:MAG: hypothetical protein V4671_08050, partial [Armatimonadota bacterium]
VRVILLSVMDNGNDDEKTGVSLRGGDADSRRLAASLMGSASTERKKATSAANGRLSKNGGRPVLPLSEIPCSCSAGMALEGHTARCLRGQAIKRRKAQGKL